MADNPPGMPHPPMPAGPGEHASTEQRLAHCDVMAAWAAGLDYPGNPLVDICWLDWTCERALILGAKWTAERRLIEQKSRSLETGRESCTAPKPSGVSSRGLTRDAGTTGFDITTRKKIESGAASSTPTLTPHLNYRRTGE